MLYIQGALICLGLVVVLITESSGNSHEDSEVIRFHVYNSDWELAFHAVEGNGDSVLDAWNAASPSDCTPDNGCIPRDFQLDYWRDSGKHLRSPLVDQWSSLNIKKIRVTFGGNGDTLAFLEFDGSGTDKLNWFSKSRLVHSSWSDIKTSGTNHFSITGDDRSDLKRHFFINQFYNQCPNDVGWFVVLDITDTCSWGQIRTPPMFLYSKGNLAANWNNSPGAAQVMNIYIQRV